MVAKLAEHNCTTWMECELDILKEWNTQLADGSAGFVVKNRVHSRSTVSKLLCMN
jgi:hypothetical protein